METSDEMDNVERQELRRGGTAGTTRTVTRRPTTGTWRVVTSTSKGHDEKTICKRTDGKDDEQSRGRQHWRSKSTNVKEDGAVDDHDTRWSSLCGEIDEREHRGDFIAPRRIRKGILSYLGGPGFSRTTTPQAQNSTFAVSQGLACHQQDDQENLQVPHPNRFKNKTEE